MDSPICDFVRRYAESDMLRLHMPGHKGIGPLDCEMLDITEISGADSLYEADGIIAISEQNASWLFGCPTFYSTEGSSQGIRAMLYLARMQAKRQGRAPVVAAGRNAHKTFLSAAALLDLQVQWIYTKQQQSYLSCPVTAADVEALDASITAVYLTSPDYLGNMVDISSIAEACHRKGILLLVDNAHGAYLRFLQPSLHPMDLGADICCDSAHKTLPVLTGGAYLHIRDLDLAQMAKNALALFGSTSPSYLILQSLDAANLYLATGYAKKLKNFVELLDQFRMRLCEVSFQGNEPMKLTIYAKAMGYSGMELSEILRKNHVECEFADPDYLVLMPTPEIGADGLAKLEEILLSIPHKKSISENPPFFSESETVLSIREAMLSDYEILPVEQCEGRILAAASVGCPPAVPIVVCGERIDKNAMECFHYYGIHSCSVVKL